MKFIFSNINNLLNERTHLYKAISETAVAYVFFFILLAIPLFLSHPQYLTGTLVNFVLFLSAIFLGKRYIPYIIILPSLSAIARGILLGPFTPFLVLLAPFIWLGNLIFIIAVKEIYFRKGKGILSMLLIPSFLKALFLFSVAYLLFNLIHLPSIFLQVMGINQFITAFFGSFLSLLVLFFIKKR